MSLSDENIADFQMLYQKHFGKEVSKDEAREQGAKLLRLMSLTYQPMTKEQLNILKVRQRKLRIR